MAQLTSEKMRGTLSAPSPTEGGGVWKDIAPLPDTEEMRQARTACLVRLQQPVEPDSTAADAAQEWARQQMRADPRLQSALGDPFAGRREKTAPVAIAMTCGSAHHNLPHPIPIHPNIQHLVPVPAIGRWPRTVDDGVYHDCEAPWPPLAGQFQLGQAGIKQSFGGRTLALTPALAAAAQLLLNGDHPACMGAPPGWIQRSSAPVSTPPWIEVCLTRTRSRAYSVDAQFVHDLGSEVKGNWQAPTDLLRTECYERARP